MGGGWYGLPRTTEGKPCVRGNTKKSPPNIKIKILDAKTLFDGNNDDDDDDDGDGDNDIVLNNSVITGNTGL